MRKQYVLGAGVVIVLLCALVQVFPTITSHGSEMPRRISGMAATIIGMGVSLYAVGAVGLGIWWGLKSSGKFLEFTNRLTLTAVIPGYFLLALMPVFAGLVLIVLTDFSLWGLGLACLAFPAILIFLALAIVRPPQS